MMSEGDEVFLNMYNTFDLSNDAVNSPLQSEDESNEIRNSTQDLLGK